MAIRQTPNLDLTVWDASADEVDRAQMTGNFDKIDAGVGDQAQRIADALAQFVGDTQSFGGLQVNGADVVDTAADQTIAGLKTFTGGVAVADGTTISLGGGTGSTVGAAGDLIAFYGATPIGRRDGYTAAGTAPNRALTAFPGTDYTTATVADLNNLLHAYNDLRTTVAALLTDLIAVGLLGPVPAP